MFSVTKLVLLSRKLLNLRVNMSMKVQNPYKISLILHQTFRFEDQSGTEHLHQKKFLFVKHATATECQKTVRKQLLNKVKVLIIKTRIPQFCNSLRINWCKQKWNTLLKLPPTKSGIWKKKRETIHLRLEDSKKPSKPTDLQQRMKWCSLETFF